MLTMGFLALVSRKGMKLHITAGNAFFVFMIGLALTTVYLEYKLGDFPIMGPLFFYFATTSWLTVKRPAGQSGYFEMVMCLLISAISFAFYKWGWDIAYGGEELAGTFPLELYFAWGSIAAFAAIMDLKLILQRGVTGKHRVARHLWRACMAFLMSLMSLLAQDVFPDPIANSGVLWLPVLVLLLIMFYWLGQLMFSTKKNANMQRV